MFKAIVRQMGNQRGVREPSHDGAGHRDQSYKEQVSYAEKGHAQVFILEMSL